MNNSDETPQREQISATYGLNKGVLQLDLRSLEHATRSIWTSLAPLVPRFLPGALNLLVEFNENVGDQYSHGEKVLFFLMMLQHHSEGLRAAAKADRVNTKFEQIMANADDKRES